MGTIIGIALMGLLLAWLLGGGRGPSQVAPEDDIDTPVDIGELEAAELEMRDDPSPRPIQDAFADDDDDWGPGTSKSNIPEF